MPIKAKYNGSYKDITDLMNVDESIDYVLAKTSSSYKRVYTATRSIEDAPPTTFKSIKSGANLTDYRIYGNSSKNILPLSKTPKTETIGDILCEYDGKGTFKFTSNVDNPTYTQDQWFWVPFEEDFDFPVGISDGGHGCIQLNNDFATGHGVTPYLVGFANRDNGEFVSGFNVAGTALNIIDTNYEVEDLEGLPANCIAFLYLHQIGKRTVTIKPALYLDIRTQQPFEPYGESVGDRTGNLFDGEIEQGGFINDGINLNEEPLYSRRIRSKQYISVIPNTVYSFSVSTALNIDLSVSFYDKSDYTTKRIGYVDWAHGNTLTFTTPTNCTYIKVLLKTEFDSSITPSDISNIMLNEGSTALPYEPYGYKVPVTVSNGTDTLTTPIYLPYQIRKVGDEAEYVDYATQKQHRVRKNLLPNTATSQTINGVTFTVNSDGSVTCNTDENGATKITYLVICMTPDIPESTKLILSGCPKGGTLSTYALQYSTWVDAAYNDVGNGEKFKKYDYETYPTARVAIRICAGCVCDNLTFYPMIRNADITDDTYEPYIKNADLDVTLPALPTVTGTNVLSVGTEVQPSKIDITGHIKTISGGS